MLDPRALAEPLRRRLAGEVRRLFHDQSRGERPVQPSSNALIPRGSVAWRVHGDVTTMMAGGIDGLLLQMLHPGALGGVWDHSNFEQDMIGRLRRTARFIAVTTYGERSTAEAAIQRVRTIHRQVGGTLPDGSRYRADDPRLLAWVHVAGAICFLDAWRRIAQPRMTIADQDSYFADVAGVAEALGADPVPRTRAAAEALLKSFLPELCADARTARVRDLVLDAHAPNLRTVPVQILINRAAIDLLPPFALRMHGLRSSGLARPLVTATSSGMAGALRWALASR